jgi:hypothetical protein
MSDDELQVVRETFTTTVLFNAALREIPAEIIARVIRQVLQRQRFWSLLQNKGCAH